MLIYEAYNKNNGKVYIGLTTNTLDVRKSSHLRSAKAGSSTYFHKAIRKHGEDAFEWSVIGTTTTLEKLYKLERLIIGMHEFEQTYNVSLGGEHSAYGMKHSEKTKQLCGEYSKKRWEGKRSHDLYPAEAFLCETYKEAKAKYAVPKTTWYRNKRNNKG